MDPDLMTDEELAERATVIVPEGGGYGMRVAANQGPGVPAELRERLINVMQFLSLPLEVINDDQACAAIEVDAILAEIAASGHVIVAGDRLERLIGALGQIDTALTFGGAEGVSKWGIRPGDLDPVEPVGGGR